MISAVLCGLAIVSTDLGAQTVRGRVTDAETGEPVPVGAVGLEDVGGARTGMTLTNEHGRYVLSAPAPGRYRIRLERIGYRGHTTAAFELRDGEDLWLPLSVRTEAVRLDRMVVVGREMRCRLPEEEGALLADLWHEARKSLELAVWDQEERGSHMRVRSYDRVLDLVSGDVAEERSRTRSGLMRHRFIARAADVLARDGYVVEERDGYTYFGLSERNILSDAFQETHCFRAREPGPDQSRAEIGLVFEPAPGRSPPDVAGVLWLDRETAELTRVEYRYTRHLLPVPVPLEPFGGATHFRRLPNGAVVVTEWRIRMPRFAGVVNEAELRSGGVMGRSGIETDGERLRRFRRAGLTIREVGATAMELGLAAARGSAGAGTAVIHGTVYDSLSGGPLVGAEVLLLETDRSARTDSAGGFTIGDVAPGRWHVGFDHSDLEVLGADADALELDVEAGDTVRVYLATPSPATVLGGRCPERAEAVVGFVRSRDDGAPAPGVGIAATWTEAGHEPVHQDRISEPARRHTVTDAAGAYALCTVPPGRRIRVEVESRPGQSLGRDVAVIPGVGGRADFFIDLAAPAVETVSRTALAPVAVAGARQGRVLGRVVAAETGEPMAGVQLRIGHETRLSDTNGRFLFLRVPADTVRLIADALGYGSLEADLAVPTGETLEVDVRMSLDPVAVDGIHVAVRARPRRLSAFRERASRGAGSFILREEIERRMPFRMTNLVSEHRLDVYGTTGSTIRIVSRRQNCAPMVYLDGRRLTHLPRRSSTAAMVEAAGAVNLVPPNEIEGVEIYAGAATVPGEFGGPTAMCGVIALWTREHE